MIDPAAAASSASSPWEQLRAPDPPPEGGWLRRHPSQLDACVEARGACLPPPLDREELEALREAHRLWRADEATMAHVEALGDPRTRVVVAGQQPDLLAGPLLVLYKALAAVKLARELADRHRTLRFVPVFWIASEDHDFDEIRRVFWPGHGGRLEEFLLPSSCWEPGRMVGAIRPQPFLARLIEQIEQTTFRTQWREEVLERLRTAYDDATDLEGGFARLLLG